MPTQPHRPATAAQSQTDAPRGAFAVAGVSVALLLIDWLAFYFFLFLPRGSVG